MKGSDFGSQGQTKYYPSNSRCDVHHKADLFWDSQSIYYARHSPRAMPQLRLLVSGISQQWSIFGNQPAHLQLAVDKMALWQVFLTLLQFSPVSIIPPMIHYDKPFICHQWYTILATGSINEENTSFHSSNLFLQNPDCYQ